MPASKPLSLEQLRLMVPAYVLDALQPAEREVFDRALASSSHKAVLQAEIELQRLAVNEMTADRSEGPTPGVAQRLATLLSLKVTPPSVEVFTPPAPRPEFIRPGEESGGSIGPRARRPVGGTEPAPVTGWPSPGSARFGQRGSWAPPLLAGTGLLLLLAFLWQQRRANELEVRLDIATRQLETHGLLGEAVPPPAVITPAEPKPEPKPVPKAEPKPVPKAEPKPEPKPVPAPAPKPVPAPAPKPVPAPAPKPVPPAEDPAMRTLRAVLGGQGTVTIVTLEPALPKGRGAAQLLWNAPVGAGVVRASGLPPLAATQGYMLWMLQRNTLVPVVRFTADAKGMASVAVPTMPKSTAGVTLFTVTVEPAGVKQPTSVPLLAGDVPAAAPAR